MTRCVVVVCVLAWSAGSAFAGTGRETVCHGLGNDGVLPLTVSASAVPAHLGHGDSLPTAFYADADGDGFGDPYAEVWACGAPEGTVANSDDCDDSADFVNPDATDECGDGVDADCSGDDALCSTVVDGWAATSGRVEPGARPGTITGRFTFTRLSETATATRGGGGCLVADLFTADPTWAGFACKVTADCNAAPYKGPFRYCASPDGSGEPLRCWTRPTDNCSRSQWREPGEYPVNVTYAPPPSVDNVTTPQTPATPKTPVNGDATGQGRDVRWMVLTCMAIATNPFGCAGDESQHVYSFGPTYLWKAPE